MFSSIYKKLPKIGGIYKKPYAFQIISKQEKISHRITIFVVVTQKRLWELV